MLTRRRSASRRHVIGTARSWAARRPVATVLIGSALALVLATSTALAAPPPQAHVFASGRSVLEGSLSGLIVLPDGWIVGEELTARFAPLATSGAELMVWDVAEDSVRALPGFEPMILPYGWVAAYHSADGRLELARVAPPEMGKVANHRLGLAQGELSLGAWLQAPGTVAVFTPVLGAVPEPTGGLSWPVLGLALVSWARRRTHRFG